MYAIKYAALLLLMFSGAVAGQQPPIAVIPTEAPVKAPQLAHPGELTIDELAAVRRAKHLSDVKTSLGVVVDKPVSPAPAPTAPASKEKQRVEAPPGPYLFSVHGPVGDEVATFRLSNGAEVAVRSGGGVGHWEVLSVAVGCVRVVKPLTTPSARRTTTTASAPRCLRPGEYLR